MNSNEFIKYIGQTVYSEQNEVLGIVIGYICNGLGEINIVLVKVASEVYEIPIDRMEFSQTGIVVLSPLAYEYKKVENKIRSAYIRMNSITKMDLTSDINKEAYEAVKSRVENTYKEVMNEATNLKNKLEDRIKSLQEKEKLLDQAIVELKLDYLTEKLDKFNFESMLKNLLDNKQKITNEISNLTKIKTLLENLIQEDTLHVKVLS